MNSILPLFEEFSAGGDKHLVIVDVQKEFERWMKPDFIKRVHEYAKKFPYVYQVWDANRAEKPSETFPNQKACVPKHYGYALGERDINNYFDHPVQDELREDFRAQKFHDAQNKRKGYVTRNGDMLIYVGASHKFFMAEKELLNLVERFKGMPGSIVLCGGADGECLADVEALMDYMGIPFQTDKEYTYKS